ncbi:hypothetical protein [Nocardia sp. NPDC057227]|uniref:hypothetical protein n=1 Tax=Nocardia sp. NPDC057227 TaxID=3346056 RepID=UPI00362F8A99
METEEEIRSLFDELTRNSQPITGTNFPGQTTELPDGTEINLRESSTSGGATIEIKYPNSSRVRKVHVP